jgi:UDP-4-amino-4,6-dideoxy-N-acetyl-beta-L-altrosamine N-acetyltransferase
MEITQRTATLDDAAQLLTWRNNSNTRKFSLYSEVIQGDEHLKWLTARLERVQFEPFFLFEVDYKAIGMSRLDIVAGLFNKFEISILVDPDQHGMGVGTRILNMTCETFFKQHPNKTIIARVHTHNLVSQKLFVNGGFEQLNHTDDFLYFEKHSN